MTNKIKVRFLCTKHECDLMFDNYRPIIAERVSDIAETVPFGSKEDKETGYYMFDLSEAWCSEDTGGKPIHNDKLEFTGHTPSECSDTWRPVLYL